jgi:hypothetical protein
MTPDSAVKAVIVFGASLRELKHGSGASDYVDGGELSLKKEMARPRWRDCKFRYPGRARLNPSTEQEYREGHKPATTQAREKASTTEKSTALAANRLAFHEAQTTAGDDAQTTGRGPQPKSDSP